MDFSYYNAEMTLLKLTSLMVFNYFLGN